MSWSEFWSAIEAVPGEPSAAALTAAQPGPDIGRAASSAAVVHRPATATGAEAAGSGGATGDGRGGAGGATATCTESAGESFGPASRLAKRRTPFDVDETTSARARPGRAAPVTSITRLRHAAA